MRTPALALIAPDHRIVQSTEAFRQSYEEAEAICERSPELELVLTGQTDAAVVNFGEVSVTIEAVTDTAGARHAMLSVPSPGGSFTSDAPLAALNQPIAESPAIAWVKDGDGRYVTISARYAIDLGTSEDALRGRTDADLPTRVAVDGPRASYHRDGLQEPLQLEYLIPAFEGRPPLAALRFAIRGRDGEPIGVCGVAAPLEEAHVAREEARRLMRIERWSRLDPDEVRAELLAEWGIAPGARAGEEPARAEFEKARAEVLSWNASAPAAAEPAVEEHEPAWDGPGPSTADHEPVGSTCDPVRQLQRDLEHARVELERARAEASAARADLELAREEREHAREERERAREEREEARMDADRSRALAAEARRVALVAEADAEAARRQRGQAEDLQRALAAERERGDKLARTLATVRMRLAELDGVIDGSSAGAS